MLYGFKDKRVRDDLKLLALDRKKRSDLELRLLRLEGQGASARAFIIILETAIDAATYSTEDSEWTLGEGEALVYRRKRTPSDIGCSQFLENNVGGFKLEQVTTLESDPVKKRVFNYYQTEAPADTPLAAMQDVYGDLYITGLAGGTTSFTKVTDSTSPAGRESTGSQPYDIAQSNINTTWGYVGTDTFGNLGGSNEDIYNPSLLPLPRDVVYPVLTDSNGKKFALPLWSCFGNQCKAFYQYNPAGITQHFSGSVLFNAEGGPGNAAAYDGELWFEVETTSPYGINILTPGSYLCLAIAQVSCTAGTGPIDGAMLLDGGSTEMSVASGYANWSPKSGTVCQQSIIASGIISIGNTDLPFTLKAIPYANSSGTSVPTLTSCWLLLMPVGFGENG